jgi:hypothetical protein
MVDLGAKEVGRLSNFDQKKQTLAKAPINSSKLGNAG